MPCDITRFCSALTDAWVMQTALAVMFLAVLMRARQLHKARHRDSASSMKKSSSWLDMSSIALQEVSIGFQSGLQAHPLGRTPRDPCSQVTCRNPLYGPSRMTPSTQETWLGMTDDFGIEDAESSGSTHHTSEEHFTRAEMPSR
jgi:hypothetical protein